jgi:hypothetical protein
MADSRAMARLVVALLTAGLASSCDAGERGKATPVKTEQAASPALPPDTEFSPTTPPEPGARRLTEAEFRELLAKLGGGFFATPGHMPPGVWRLQESFWDGQKKAATRRADNSWHADAFVLNGLAAHEGTWFFHNDFLCVLLTHPKESYSSERFPKRIDHAFCRVVWISGDNKNLIMNNYWQRRFSKDYIQYIIK